MDSNGNRILTPLIRQWNGEAWVMKEQPWEGGGNKKAIKRLGDALSCQEIIVRCVPQQED